MANTICPCSWKLVLVAVLFLLFGVESLPYRLKERKPRLTSPDILKSRPAKPMASDLSDVVKMTKNWVEPAAKDLNETMLLQKLGRHFDSFYMSVEAPKSSRRVNAMALSMRSSTIRRQEASMPKMPKHVRNMRFEIKRREKGRARILGFRASSKLRQWLWELSRCPINYSWVDYGKKLFPRYIRYGKCIQKPCSFPSGMTCRPKSTRTLRVLMWICPGNIILSCKWRPFKFTVYESCQCGCDKE